MGALQNFGNYVPRIYTVQVNIASFLNFLSIGKKVAALEEVALSYHCCISSA